MKRAEAPLGTIVPMRFFLRDRKKEPNARVIVQDLNAVMWWIPGPTESPTLSRLAKYLLVVYACIKRWRLGTMDVKSAFLQSDYIHKEVEIYGEPSADLRRLLAEMIGLKVSACFWRCPCTSPME